MSSPASSFLSLNINNITFLITKAHIKESLESLFTITCEGYIESLKDNEGRMVVRLGVGYDTGEMVLEVMRKWEYRGGGNSNADN